MLLEGKGVDARVLSSEPVGGQGVVGSGSKVTASIESEGLGLSNRKKGSRAGRQRKKKDARFRRPSTNEHTSSVHHILDQVLRAFDLKDQVFRSVLVAEIHRLLSSLDVDDDGLGDSFPGDLTSRQSAGLDIDLSLDSFQLGRRKRHGDQDDLRVDSMLGLRQKIGSHKDWVRLRISNHL